MIVISFFPTFHKNVNLPILHTSKGHRTECEFCTVAFVMEMLI